MDDAVDGGDTHVFSFPLSAVCCAVLTGLFASLVLSTLPRPRLDFVMALDCSVARRREMEAFRADCWRARVSAALMFFASCEA